MAKSNKTEEELNRLSPEVKGKLVAYLQAHHQLDISTPENQLNNLKNLTPEMVNGFYDAEKVGLEGRFSQDDINNPTSLNHNRYKTEIKPFLDAKNNLSNAIRVDKAANTQENSPLHDDQERHAQQLKTKIGDYRKQIQEDETFQTKLGDNARGFIERAILQQNTGLIQSDAWTNIFLFLFKLKGKDKFMQLIDDLNSYIDYLNLPSEKAKAFRDELERLETEYSQKYESLNRTDVTPLVDPVFNVLVENGHGEALLSDILVQNGAPAVQQNVPPLVAGVGGP
jgi:hypothetical protein